MTPIFEKYAVLSPKAQPQDGNPDRMTRVAWLDDDVVSGAPYFEAVWVHKDLPGEVAEHAHDFDEFLGYVGSDPTTDDLGCTVEFTLNGETMKFTKNFVVYIPAGMPHCPMRVYNVTRPVLNYSGGPNVKYLRKYEDGTYKVN